MPARTRLLALATAIALAACGSSDEGGPTGSTCPEDSTLSYESFGQEFMDAYCTRCHASDLTGDDRNGAPLNHDFDTKAGILAVADHIDEQAAAGPDNVNTAMPPRAPKPTEEERRQLGEWLACELARQ
jgi:uncharacterized membrane protein